jgi:hypothetical protein
LACFPLSFKFKLMYKHPKAWKYVTKIKMIIFGYNFFSNIWFKFIKFWLFEIRRYNDKSPMNVDIDNFLVQSYAKQIKELNSSTGKESFKLLFICQLFIKEILHLMLLRSIKNPLRLLLWKLYKRWNWYFRIQKNIIMP